MNDFKRQKEDDRKTAWIILILVVILWGPGDLTATGKYALLIGINDYKISGITPLEGAENDLRMIKKVLLDKLDFNEKNILTLTNRQATHSGIENAFSQLAGNVGTGDFVYIHYCGHGSRVPDKNGDEYPGLFDQTWVPYGSRSNRMSGKDGYDITDDEIHLWLTPIFHKTENVVFVSDSCHSGSVTRGDVLAARSVPIDTRQYPVLLIPGDNIPEKQEGIVIGAVQDDGLAYEASFHGETHGLFSWFWAHSLRRVRRGETWGDVFNRTRVMVSNYSDRQYPQFQGDRDKRVFDYGSERIRHRIPVSRVWNKGKKVRIEAGALSGVAVGSTFRLYTPGENKNAELPTMVVTRVKPFYSEGTAKGTFHLGDLVIREGNPDGVNPLKNLVSNQRLEVELEVNLWRRTGTLARMSENSLALPGNNGWFKKAGTFKPAETGKRPVFPSGGLLTFKARNNSGEDFYIYLLDVMDNGKVEVVFPAPGDRFQRALLPAGGEMDLKDMVVLLLDRPGNEMINMIVADTPVDINLWGQNASHGAQGTCRGTGRRWEIVQFPFTVKGR